MRYSEVNPTNSYVKRPAAIAAKLFVDRVSRKGCYCQPNISLYAAASNKTDNGKENVKMANMVVAMATLFMAFCAGIKVM